MRTDSKTGARGHVGEVETNLADDTVDFYSLCVSPGTSRISTQLALERGVLQHSIDVGGAYYKGTPKLPEDGGRLVNARVPAYLHSYSEYPTHGPYGTPNLHLIVGIIVRPEHGPGNPWKPCQHHQPRLSRHPHRPVVLFQLHTQPREILHSPLL